MICEIAGSLSNWAATVAGPGGNGSVNSYRVIWPYVAGSLDTTIIERSSFRESSEEKGTNGRNIENTPASDLLLGAWKMV